MRVPFDGGSHREESGIERRSPRAQCRALEKLPAGHRPERSLAAGTPAKNFILPGNTGIEKPRSRQRVGRVGLKFNSARSAQSLKANVRCFIAMLGALSIR